LITVAAPKETGAKSIEGNGWTLDLNDGWTITAGKINGNFTLKNNAK
jgi:hypothetical protein